MEAKWRDAVFVEVQFAEFSSTKKDATYRTFNINLKSFDGDDLTHKSFLKVNEETGEVQLERVFTQIIASKLKPKLLLSLKEAIGGKDYDKKDEILNQLKEISLNLGTEASTDYREFAKKITEKFEGHQFKIYWRGRGITTTNQQIRAGVANSQIAIFPIGQKDHIGNKSLEDFINIHREGSIEERNEEAVSALDGLSLEDDNKESILEEGTKESKKKGKGKEETFSTDDW